MKIKVLSREQFEEFNCDERYIVISITDPNSEPVIVPDNKNYKAMLSLEFSDIDHRIRKQEDCKLCDGTGKSKLFSDLNDGRCHGCTDNPDIVLFTENDAQQILDFVRLNAGLVVIHCEAGISRSAGVASALSLIYNGTDQYYFDHYLPNMLVYRKILNAHMKDNIE